MDPGLEIYFEIPAFRKDRKRAKLKRYSNGPRRLSDEPLSYILTDWLHTLLCSLAMLLSLCVCMRVCA